MTPVILPQDISTKPQAPFIHAFVSFFGKHEMDVAARLIVEVLSRHNKWEPFLLSDIIFAGRHSKPKEIDDFVIEGFEELLSRGWIKHAHGSLFVVSDDFINRCKEKSDQRVK